MTTRVWLPFPASRLGEVSPQYAFTEFAPGAPPDDIAEVEVWVPHYGFALPYAELVPQMRRLRVIQTQSAGVEHVSPYVPDGVTLCNARGVHDAATSELGVALILASLRGLPGFFDAQGRGEWLRPARYESLADKTVLIVGYGSIGAALDRRLAGFECEVVRVARHARDGVHPIDELPALIPAADVVVVLTPLNDQTRHLIGAELLAAMKDGALLVNLARGAVVDTAALLAELSAGRLRAALDVTDPEPLPRDHPLWTAPGVLISPHTAGGTSAMEPRITALVRDQLERYATGRDLRNVVT